MSKTIEKMTEKDLKRLREHDRPIYDTWSTVLATCTVGSLAMVEAAPDLAETFVWASGLFASLEIFALKGSLSTRRKIKDLEGRLNKEQARKSKVFEYNGRKYQCIDPNISSNPSEPSKVFLEYVQASSRGNAELRKTEELQGAKYLLVCEKMVFGEYSITSQPSKGFWSHQYQGELPEMRGQTRLLMHTSFNLNSNDFSYASNAPEVPFLFEEIDK
jgi:hypothetical protein